MDELEIKSLSSFIDIIIERALSIAPRDKFFVFLDPLGSINHTILLYLKENTDPARGKALESAIQLMLIQLRMLIGSLEPSDAEYVNSDDSELDAVLHPSRLSGILPQQDLLNNALKDKNLHSSFLFIVKLLRYHTQKLGEEINILSNFDQIIREIVFPPEFYQAGVSILSYFREILIQKYPDINVGVSIKQEGSKVTMVISPPSGKVEIISKALQDYGMAITGKLDVHAFLNSDIQVIALKHKLELASLEIKHTRELMYTERQQYEKRIENMEQEVKRFHYILANNLKREPSILALIDLLKSTQTKNNALIERLIALLDKDITQNDEADFKQAISELKHKEPTLFGKFHDMIVFGTLTSTAGNYLYAWLNAVCASLK